MAIEHDVDICIIGLGPAGIGAALTLSQYSPKLKVLGVDMGDFHNDRYCSILKGDVCRAETPCQMICGFGGCSLLCGGKLSAFPAGSKFSTILGSQELAEKKLSEAFNLLSGYLPSNNSDMKRESCLIAEEFFYNIGFNFKFYDVHTFIPNDVLNAYTKISKELISRDMNILMKTRLINIEPINSGFKLLLKNEKEFTIFTKYLILALGRSGKKQLIEANKDFDLGAIYNHLDIGVRLEFPTSLWPDINKYHGDLKLLFGDARTFCVCKDGKIANYMLDDILFTEGHFNSLCKTGYTNLGIMIRLKPSDKNNLIYRNIRENLIRVTQGKPLCQNLSSYLDKDNQDTFCDDATSLSFYVKGAIDQIYPPNVSERLKYAVDYFVTRIFYKSDWKYINLIMPEIDFGGLSFPIKSDFSICPKMYLIGDCTSCVA